MNGQWHGWALACLLVAVGCVMMSVCPANAQSWSKPYMVSAPVNAGMSDHDALVAAMNRIRVKASEDAGKYVQGEEVVAGGRYAKSIHIVSAAIVKLNVLSKTFFHKNDKKYIRVKAAATVDGDLLKQQIKAIQHNAQLAINLRHENDALSGIFLKLSEIDKKLASMKKTSDSLLLQSLRISEGAALIDILNKSRAEMGLGNLDSLYKESMKKNIASQQEELKKEKIAMEQRVKDQSYNIRLVEWLKRNYYQHIASNTAVKLHVEGVSASKIMAISVKWDTHMGCPVRSRMMKKLGFYFSNYTVQNPDVIKTSFDPDAINYDLGSDESIKSFLGGCVSWPSTWDMGTNMEYRFYRHIQQEKHNKKQDVWVNIGGISVLRTLPKTYYVDITKSYYGDLPVLYYMHSHNIKLQVYVKSTGERIASILLFDGKKLTEKGERTVYFKLHDGEDISQGLTARVVTVVWNNEAP